MALHPVGPLPPSTYWRRRAVLLVSAVVVLLLLRSCVGGGAAPAKKDTLSASPKPTATRPVAPKPAVVKPTTAPTTAPTTTPTTAPVVATCTDAQLNLTATTDASSYGPGATPKITLSITNTSATPCRRDVGAGAVEILVYSGADRIWSSNDCSPSKAVALQVLAPAGSQAVVKTWPGRRSKPGCAGSKAAAAPGTYVVTGRVGTLKRSSAGFTLHG
jgi:hypothetical protein